MFRVLIALIAAFGVLSSSACTHSMRIVNANEYPSSARSEHSLTIGIESESSAEDTKALVEAVKRGLDNHSSVVRAAYVDEAPPDFKPDLIVRVEPTTKYKGSGLNYLITFPGFLLFTHAWNGFNYKAKVRTEITLFTPDGETPFASDTLLTRWQLRHCDFGRGAWTSSGWYTPAWGAVNLIIGFFMVQYDTDATPEFTRVVAEPYGHYIADRVVELAAKQPVPEPPQPDTSGDFSPSVDGGQTATEQQPVGDSTPSANDPKSGEAISAPTP